MQIFQGENALCKFIEKLFEQLKGAMKLFFMHCLCVVIILFNKDLYKSAFSTYSFKETTFCLPVFYVFFIYSVLNSVSSLDTFL